MSQNRNYKSGCNRGPVMQQSHKRALCLSTILMAAAMFFLSEPGFANEITIRGEFSKVDRSPRGLDMQQPGSSDLLDQGIHLYKDGDIHGAIAIFSQAITQDSQNVLAYMYRGLARERLGDYINAIGDFQQVRIAAIQPTVLDELGHCYTNLNNFHGALNSYNTSLAMDRTSPSAIQAYAGRAAVKRILRDTQGALADCDAAIGLNPKDADARWQRGVTYFDAQQYTKAVPDLKIVVQQSSKFADAYLLLGQSFQKLGMRPDAIAEYQKANYLYHQLHDDEGAELTTTKLKTLQSEANAGDAGEKKTMVHR